MTTQIVYDAERLAGWADRMRARGLFERAKVLIGVTPLRSAKQARYMDEKLPGVRCRPRRSTSWSGPATTRRASGST